MPFALNSDILTELFGEDYKIYEFNSFADNNLVFKPATSYYAGYPYLVFVKTAATHENGVILKDVNVSTTNANYDNRNGAYFQSTYAPVAAGSLENWYGVTNNGEVRKAGAGATLSGFRAYFTGISSSAHIAVIDDNGEATYIRTIEIDGQADGIYNVNGQKMNNNLKKGVYIMGGKKIYVK